MGRPTVSRCFDTATPPSRPHPSRESPTSRLRRHHAVTTTTSSLTDQRTYGTCCFPRPCRGDSGGPTAAATIYSNFSARRSPRKSSHAPALDLSALPHTHQDKAGKSSDEANRLARELDSARAELEEASKATVERVGQERAAAEAAARALEDRWGIFIVQEGCRFMT